MPAELRALILLNVPDYETLRSLVHASPEYHQSYLTIKREVLQGLVQREYNQVSISEAITAVRSFSIHAQTPCHAEAVIVLLDRRRRPEEIQRSSAMLAPNEPNNLDIKETIELVRMQMVASFFIQDFCRNAPCPPWIDRTKWAKESLPIQLSEDETSRFLRAFYRLQIFCNLFDYRENHSEEYFPKYQSLTKPSISSAFSYDEIWDLFFATMPP